MHWFKIAEDLVHFQLSPHHKQSKVLGAAACCGMLQNPHVQLEKPGAAACCSLMQLHMLGWLDLKYLMQWELPHPKAAHRNQ